MQPEQNDYIRVKYYSTELPFEPQLITYSVVENIYRNGLSHQNYFHKRRFSPFYVCSHIPEFTKMRIKLAWE